MSGSRLFLFLRRSAVLAALLSVVCCAWGVGDASAAMAQNHTSAVMAQKHRGVVWNEYGAVVGDPSGGRRNYEEWESEAQAAAFSRGEAKPPVSAAQAGPGPGTSAPQINVLWSYPFYLSGIGASGFATMKNNGVNEIYMGCGSHSFGGNTYWCALVYDPDRHGYRSIYASPAYPSGICRVDVGNVTGDARKEIVVLLTNGDVYLYDAATKALVSNFSTQIASPKGMKIANVDRTGLQELVIVDSSNLYAISNGATQWSISEAGGYDVAVAQMDSDASMEIAVTSGKVIDADTKSVQWAYNKGFGYNLRAADIDADTKAELIAAESWYFVWAYDVDTQLPKWSHPTDLDVDAIEVADIDADSVVELIVGDGQWGDVYAVDTVTGAREWAIPNPEHGVTNIAVADSDDDGTKEVIWGSGYSSTGQDLLCVGDWKRQAVEWNSIHLDGPIIGPEIGDLDGDGTDEIVAVSFESESGYSSGRILVFDSRTCELRATSAGVAGDLAWTGVHDMKLRDVDGDGRKEVLIATDHLYDGVIEIYDFAPDNTFSLQWTNTEWPEGSPFWSVEAYDADSDGSLEIVAGGGREHTGAAGVFVYVYSYATKQEEWHTFQLGDYWDDIAGLAVGNFDSDAAPEIVAVVGGGGFYVFDGVSRSVEAIVTGSFTTIAPVGNTLVLGGGTGFVEQYRYTGSSYLRIYSSALSASSIDGLTVQTLSPFTLYVGAGGVQRSIVSGALQAESANYGVPYGARCRNGFTAGAYCLTSSGLPAPRMRAEPQITWGDENFVYWESVLGADQYMAEVDSDPAFGSPEGNTGWTPEIYCQFQGLTMGQTYYYRVKSKKASSGIESVWSPAVSSQQRRLAAAEDWALYE